MNVYEFDIWCSVRHSGKFSHTAMRFQTVHALNEERAKRKVTLAQSKTMGTEPHLIEAAAEFIYSVRKTGTVKKQLFYVYSDGRTPRPVVKTVGVTK